MSGLTTQVIDCPDCTTGLRMPQVDARIRVTCPNCGTQFEWAPSGNFASGQVDAPEVSQASYAPATPRAAVAPSGRTRVWSGALLVAIATGVLLYFVGDDVSPLIRLPAIALAYWGMARIYRGLRPRGGNALGGMRRLPAVAATWAIVWGASAAGMGAAGAVQQLGMFDRLSLGGGGAGASRADLRLDNQLEGEADSQFQAARAAAAQATTAPARAAAVDAFSEAAATAALSDDLDALERILEEQIAAQGGS